MRELFIKADGVSNELRQSHKLRAVIRAHLGRRFCFVFKTDDMGQHQLCFFPASFVANLGVFNRDTSRTQVMIGGFRGYLGNSGFDSLTNALLAQLVPRWSRSVAATPF